jgi:hypothetical protein
VAEKKINGRTFRVDPMLATKALVLQARLFRVAGPAIERLPEILVGLGGNEEEQRTSNGAAIGAFASIFAQSSPDDLADIVKEVAEIARIRRPSGAYDALDFDGDMTGHQADLIPLVIFVLQEQFGDFFSAVPGLGRQSIPDQA